MAGGDDGAVRSAGCPSPEALRDFVLGALPPGEHGAVARHVDGCPACTAALAGLDDGDALVDLLQRPIALGPVPEDVLRLVLEAIEPTAEWMPTPGAVPPPASASGGERFRVVRPLAAGGIGLVSVAVDRELNREVALKEIRGRFARDPGNRARFLREAELTCALEHPGIVPVYSLGQHPDGRPYYAMRLIRGETLRQAISRFHRATRVGRHPLGRHNLGLRGLLGSFLDACNAVAYAHSRGILHRDLKPSNILLGPFGETLVVDWGMAKRLGASDGPPDDLPGGPDDPGGDAPEPVTGPGTAVGTPQYMSPEQAGGGDEEPGPASDVYSLGATLYCLLTDRAPFPAPVGGREAMEAVLEEVRRGEFPRPRALRPDVPPALEAICLKAMALAPEARYPSPLDLAEDLERWLADEPVSALDEGWPGRLARWLRRHQAGAQAAAAVTLIVAGVAVAAAIAVDAARRDTQLAFGRERQAHARAVASGREATASAREADARRMQAEHSAEETRMLTAELALDRGLTLLEQGDGMGGMLWLTRGLQLAPAGAGDLRRAIRINLAAWWAEFPRLRSQLAHGDPIWAMALSPDGRVALTGGEDAIARLWDADTGRPLGGPLLGHERTIRAAAFGPDGRTALTASIDGTVVLWEIPSGRRIRTIPVGSPVAAAAFSPDGRSILTGDEGGLARLWDATTGEPEGPPLEHPHEVHAVGFSADGRILATACEGERVVRLWDRQSRALVCTPFEHPAVVHALAFSPTAPVLASAGADNRAFLWSRASVEILGGVQEHRNWIISLAFSPDGRALLTGGYDGTARSWDVATGQPLGLPVQHPRELTAVAVGGDGRILATASHDGTVRFWDVPEGLGLGEPLRRDAPLAVMAASGDGRTLLGREPGEGGDPPRLRLWDVAAAGPVGEPIPLRGELLSAAFSPDGRALLTGSKAGDEVGAWLWDAATGRELLPAPLPVQALSAAFSPDGRTVLTGTWDSARLWDVATGDELGEPMLHRGEVRAVAFSPDGRTLLTGSGDHRALLWEGGRREPARALIGHNGAILAAAFDPGGRLIATGSKDGTARLWDAETGRPRGEPLPHRGPVWAVAFAPDGRSLVTGSQDRTARMWDIATGRPLGPPLRHRGPVRAAAFAGGAVLITGDDQAARSWRVVEPVADPIGRIIGRAMALTGLRLDAQGGLHALAPEARRQILRLLEEDAGSSPPGAEGPRW